MEVSLLDGGISRLQNPSGLLHRRLLALSEFRSLWTWAALLLASLAAFTGLIRRARRIVLRLRRGKSVIPSPPPYFSSTDDDESDGSCSSDEDEDEDEEETASSYEEKDDLAVGPLWDYADDEGGNFTPELFGGGIVKAWDGFGRSSDVGSLLHLDGGIAMALAESPAVVVSAASEIGGGALAVRAWDARADKSAAEWRALRRRPAGIACGGDGRRVYVSDDVGGVAELDLRNTRGPVWETWWETVVGNDGRKAERGRSVTAWCWNVVRNIPIIPSSK